MVKHVFAETLRFVKLHMKLKFHYLFSLTGHSTSSAVYTIQTGRCPLLSTAQDYCDWFKEIQTS